MKKLFLILATVVLFRSVLSAGEIVLADDGKTSYAAVLKKNASKAEKAAFGDLCFYMKQISGADFRTAEGKTRRIWVGKSAPSDKEPLLRDERRIKMDNGSLYIYGEGEHGSVNAVYDFLKDLLGCRWFTFYGLERIPKQRKIVLAEDLHHSVVPSIPYVSASMVARKPAGVNFSRRNFLRERTADIYGSPGIHAGQRIIPSGLVPFGRMINSVSGPLKYFKDKAYWKSNPEFFSMDKKGRRVTTMQLCYSNPGLRDEYEKNIRIMLKAEKYSGGMKVVGLGQEDTGGGFCYCPKCVRAEKRHDHPAGAYYDFLLDMSRRFRKTHPELLLAFLAYRDYQTLFPSKLLTELPDNLMPSYAPLGADFSKSFNHPVNAEEFRQFANWAKISKKMHWWAYPTTYPRPVVGFPLVANINRLVENFRIAHRNKVYMAYCEFGISPYINWGFNDLRTYMLLELCRRIDTDAQVIIREFTDAAYGSAAGVMRQYLAELEKMELEEQHVPLRWNPNILIIEYTTPANLLRWQKLFDKMERLVAGRQPYLLGVRRVRFNLDETTIARWSMMTPDERAGFGDLETIIKRARQTIREDAADTFLSLKKLNPAVYERNQKLRYERIAGGLDQYIASARGGKPLPSFFNGKKSYRVLPERNKLNLDKDEESAFGLCNTGRLPRLGNWFNYRSYQRGRTPNPMVKQLPQPVTYERVKQRKNHDRYQFYYMGAITLDQDAQVGFSAISPLGGFAVGHLYDRNDPDRVFDLYVSLAADFKAGKVRLEQLVLVPLDDHKKGRAFRKSKGEADTQDMFQ